MADVARAVGVSIPTVSYILNGRARERNLSQITTERVMAAAKQLGYVRNNLARNLRRRETHTITILVADLERGIANRLMMGALPVFDPAGFFTSLTVHFWDPERERRELQAMLEEQRAAIIIRPMIENTDLYRRVHEMGTPIILLDGIDALPEVSVSMWDSRKAIEASVAHLAATGRRRIAFYGVDRGTLAARWRLEGFQAGLEKAGLHFHPEFVCLDQRYALQQLDNGRLVGYGTRLHEVFASPGDRPDAVLCASDALACTAITILRDDMGLDVPRGIAIMGMGDTGESELIGLSTSYDPVEVVGRNAAEIALDLIQGRSGGPVSRFVSPCEIRPRSTTPPVAGALNPNLESARLS